VEAPVYWEQLEPQPGTFDFTNVDALIEQARQHSVHLILLWFGGWKNGSMHYAPAWVKADKVRHPRMVNAAGSPMDILSVHSAETFNADRKAFVTLMRHLKQIDGEQHTVLLVQVENEPGSYGTVRDYSPTAQKAFEGQVPREFASAIRKPTGTWQQVFGKDAEEVFSAYSAASYIGGIAAAGKAEYALPMYINAALRDPLDEAAKPGQNYPSGGPSFNVLDVWKAAAPALDIITPNIYLRDAAYLKTLDLYARNDNPLLVVETSNDASFAKYLFSVIGRGGLGFAPFGIDYTGYNNYPLGSAEPAEKSIQPFAEEYKLFAPMVREIARLNFEGKIKTAIEEKSVTSQSLDFGKWQVDVSYGVPEFGFGNNPPGNPLPDGRVLVAQLGPDEFLVTGIDARVVFKLSPSEKGKQVEYVRVEEGRYENGNWHFLRIWNGDQTDWGLNFKHVPYVLRVKLDTY
jgi:beta-galactosidase GanA